MRQNLTNLHLPRKPAMKAEITNALIRCRRADQAAQPEFELVRDDLGLWVRELPESLDELVSDLLEIRPLLKDLGSGSSDFTLHLTAYIDELHSLVLPPILSAMAGECGFAIEVYGSPT